jgi:ribosomal protein L9
MESGRITFADAKDSNASKSVADSSQKTPFGLQKKREAYASHLQTKTSQNDGSISRKHIKVRRTTHAHGSHAHPTHVHHDVIANLHSAISFPEMKYGRIITLNS